MSAESASNSATSTEPATETRKLTVDKKSAEHANDRIRELFARSFALEYKFDAFGFPGSIQSTYLKDKDGRYLLHNNGVARRLSALCCKFGFVVWLIESCDLGEYTVEIRNILGEVEKSYYYQRSELEQIFEKHRSQVCYQDSVANYSGLLDRLSRVKLAEEHRTIKRQLAANNLTELDREQLKSRLSLVQTRLTALYENLIEEAFLDQGNVGRRFYLRLVEEDLKNQKITTPLYWLIKSCVKSGLTFIWRVKELTEEEIGYREKLDPKHPLYGVWLDRVAEYSGLLIEELSRNQNNSLNNLELPKLLKRISKR